MTGISSLRASSTEFPMAPRATKSDENTRLQSPDREGGGSSGACFSTEGVPSTAAYWPVFFAVTDSETTCGPVSRPLSVTSAFCEVVVSITEPSDALRLCTV